MQDQAVNELPWTGERLVPTCRGQILYEHLHRYAVAVTLAHGKRVLDIACGEGYGSNLLAATAAQVIGVDIASEVIAHARQAYRKENLIFREGSCLNIPVDDKSIDLVVSFETIEHLDDHEQFLREIKRVLSDSGALIISSPDKREYTDRIGNKNRFHKLELNHEDFYSLLKKHFKNCRIAKQRLVVGSWIAPDKTSAGDVPGTFGGDIGSVDFQGGVPQGIYSIALCSDASLPKLKFGIFEDSRESKNTWALLERSNSTPTLQVFADCGEGFVEACSMVANLQPDAWQTIHFENFERISAIGSSNVQRLRVDPVDRPACVIISRILITGYSDGATIYSAASPAEFDAIRCSAGLLKHSGEEGLFLIATDADPQLYLPHFDLVTSNPCRFELTLKISLNPTEAVIRYHRALRDNSLLRETLRVSEDSKKQINELRTKNDQQREELRALTSKREQLKREAAQAQRQIQATESENTLLSNRLVALEQNVRDFANTFGLNRQGLGQADSPTAALIRSLSRSIRQLRWKALFWKVAKLLGLKATAGINPRSAASQLKRELEGVKRILKSKKTSPAEALAALTALIFLRRRATTHFTRSRAMSSRDSASMQALFDQLWYTKTHPAAATTPMPPLQYYLTLGVKEGHNPHPLFDVNWYLSRPPRLENLEISPLEHYAGHGPSDERSPHPQFDSAFYIAQCPDCLSSDLPPLAHYLTTGWKLGCRPNPNFDPKFYLQTYPEVAAAKIEPLTHYVLWGQSEGRLSCQENVPFRFSTPDFEIPRTPLSSDSVIVPRVKAIAFYLPQFHPIPENDRWWGEGFTEWDNVRSGSPNYPDHYQPHVPIDLGYYDLRDPEVLRKQTELARTYGISGFCFYYYWFGGKVLLDLPIRTMLESGRPDFPFCICWANENWTRRWDGLEDDVLIAQSHSPEDDINFIRRVENVLLQKNYIRVRGKPLLLVYRPSLFPDSLETTERWRDYFRRKGHGELHLVMVRSFHDQTAPEVYGFDAAVQFPPHFATATITSLIAGKDEKFKGTIHDYTEMRRVALEQLITASSTGKTYAAVMPSWDNTARRGSHAGIWANSSPESYYEWLSAAVEQVQKKEVSDERLIFINAWNEWAEGCHLEPDEKYGHAWLNATALALRPPACPLPRTSLAAIHPEPPRTETIKVPALRDRLRLVISVLFYHREDLIERFLQSILRQILKAESQGDIECSLSLSFNYQPDAAVIAQIHQIIATTSYHRADAVHILENGFNVGFGAGHNMVFDKFDSDIFLIMNSDVRVMDQDWLVKLVDRFRGSDAVIVGLSETASRLREDGCGIPIKSPEEEYDFVDGSALAIRSDLARRFGLFSPSYDYFYFEDADLCLRYRQMGLQIALLDAPYEHERSSSSRLLPQFAVENVLDRNRARLFEKWGNYLRTRTLSNRIGVRFLEIDRQLQCASLPALFGLLAEHGTAVMDLWGIHEQLGELFQHPRIRLIPSWQTLREDDYLRHYDLATNQAETPRVYDIANRMGCDPDFVGAKTHLESLIGSAYSENSKPSKTALLYVARKSPLFDGKEPNAESFAPVAKMLRERNFKISLYTDYGTFETQTLNGFGTADWNHAALCPGIELLKEIAAAGLLVTSNNWVAELGQLLQKRTFLWLGAMSCRAAIWDFERAGCFSDQSLSCLGCYHQFGRNRHNVCLRGDIACMRPQLAKDFVASLETFLGGEPLKAVAIHPNRFDLTSHRTMPSTELSLEHWPSSTANSVLVLTPVNPQLDERALERAKELAHRALQGMRNCRVVHDNCGEAPVRGQPHPYRQAAMASLRQSMIERYLENEQWVFWVDADIVDYPPFLIEQLIQRAEGGIAAPLVLMEGEITEPVHKDGFGPGRFFDIAGFVENGRWARFTAPYFDQPGPIYRLDSVGSCYLVNADLYRMGAAHSIDPASEIFLNTNETWSRDAIARNQRGPANAYTEHYSVCQFAIRHGLPVQAFADLVASHQKV